MLMIDRLKKEFKTGYTITPIMMIRKEGTETCYDARPLYGPDGKWLKPEERGPECPHQHVSALRCTNGASAHRHKAECFHRVHANVEVPGLLFVSGDGKFQAKVFLDAETTANSGWSPNWKGLQPTFRAPKLKASLADSSKDEAA